MIKYKEKAYNVSYVCAQLMNVTKKKKKELNSCETKFFVKRYSSDSKQEQKHVNSSFKRQTYIAVLRKELFHVNLLNWPKHSIY